MLSGEKGRYATATENRRFAWREVVWPLVLEINDVVFTLKQYQHRRDRVCAERGIGMTVPSRGLASLLQKGILRKEGDLYSIHYRLIPYMRLRATCDYATAIREAKIR